jgi:acetyltransferase-like isoleucine patch superfamily enzyme
VPAVDRKDMKGDPLEWFSRLLTRLYTNWIQYTFAFCAFGRGVSIHYSCDISKRSAENISVGDDVYLAPDVWLNTAPGASELGPKIVLSNGCKIGRRSMISSRKQIVLESDVLLAPSVLLMDHNHEYSDPTRPIYEQGVTAGGRIVIGKNCWLGAGSAILCAHGELALGQNCVVGARSVVTRSFPAFSVIAGNPAKLIKTYDQRERKWVKVSG